MIGHARAAGLKLRVVFVCPALLEQRAEGPALAAAVVASGAEGYEVSERGAGASAVLVVEQGFGLGHPLVVRASMGAALTMPVVAVGRRPATQWLREHGSVAGALLRYEVLAQDTCRRGYL
jgi:hypothetical protein